MEKGRLYGVGVGPGDPELLTIKAARVLKEADVVAVPDRGTGENTALDIVKEHVEGKELLYCSTPMIRDREILDGKYREIAGNICGILDEGRSVAFITLGDPSVYSTYMYVHDNVVSRGYEAEMVPGITSFCAAAARLGTSLCEGPERLLIVPGGSGFSDAVDTDANKVFMKAGRGILDLRDELGRAGKLEDASVVENCGMEGERIWKDFSSMEDGSGYYSIVIVK